MRQWSSIKSAVLAASLALTACGKPTREPLDNHSRSEGVHGSLVTQKVQGAASFAEPPRYVRLSDLAADIREAGHACESVRSYAELGQRGKGVSVYKVDCLEYSYELTVTDGTGQIRRLRNP
jgi:hypothetical protein